MRNAAYGALAARRRDGATSLDAGAAPGEEGEGAALQVPDPADNPEATLVRREGLDRLDRALAALPIELRERLALRELEELSYKKVAHVTGTASTSSDLNAQELADFVRLWQAG